MSEYPPLLKEEPYILSPDIDLKNIARWTYEMNTFRTKHKPIEVCRSMCKHPCKLYGEHTKEKSIARIIAYDSLINISSH